MRRVARWGPLLVITILSGIAAQLVWAHIIRSETPRERFARLIDGGELHEAEEFSWEFLEKNPHDVRAWVWFIDAHARANSSPEHHPDAGVVSHATVDALLAEVGDPEVSVIASFWIARTHGKPADARAIAALAARKPAARTANYVLGRVALDDGDWRSAATYFEREGFSIPADRDRFLAGALAIWFSNDDWDSLRVRARDPRYADVFDAYMHARLAGHDRDIASLLFWVWPAAFGTWQVWPVALALLAAVLWFLISTRLGRIQDRVGGRARLYGLSFVLGVLSIPPTLLIIVVEEQILGLKQLGQFVPDVIYFVFGVGLREEACKLLLFLPLLPVLLRRGSRIEAMTCGALVGLGFAAAENIGYFAELGGAAALPRFLTANFLHMSLTAMVALSAFDARRGRATPRDSFNVVFPMAVLIHGAYDFFLTTGEIPLSWLISLALFFVIAQQFLRQLTIASSRAEEQDVLNLLIASMAAIAGASYVYATTLAGPISALGLVFIGFLATAIVIVMFVRELSSG
jgi:RsiW-degrading membrane proteinase PrsW (M82 family)